LTRAGQARINPDIMAGTFGNPNFAESFMLPEGQYLIQADSDSPQCLLFPVVSFGKNERIEAILEYLDERDLWLAAPIDASKHEIADTEDYQLTGDSSSAYGQAMDAIQELEASKELPEGSHQKALQALMNCAFEQSPFYPLVRTIKDSASKSEK
jgi:hypothetical protein